MVDVIATAEASKLLEALAADRDIPDEARRMLIHAVGRFDDQLRRSLNGKAAR